MALPDDFIYQLRLANPIEDVFSSYASMKRNGATSKCLCPFHSEKTPSCTVYRDTQSFYCFGCGAGGDVISFIMRIENLSYIEAVRFLSERAGIAMPENNIKDNSAQIKARIYEINRETANFYYKTLISGNDKRGLAYFRSRSLLPQTIKKYGLGYAPFGGTVLRNHLRSLKFHDSEMVSASVCRANEKGVYDNFRGRVIFPIVDLRGNIIAFGGRKLEGDGPKYINTSDTPVFKKSRNLFSLNFAKNSSVKKLILAEGYMDVIAINQAGFENAVATLGTALTPEQARIMSQYATEVIIAYDSDGAGQAATQRAINLLSAAGVNTKIIKMTGAKDPDEFIKKFGSTRFKMLLENSDDAIVFELEKCKYGLDLNTETGKVDFLRKAVAVISSLDDPLQRDVYTSKVSREADININVLRTQIEHTIRNKNNIKKKREWKSIEQGMNFRDEINPDAVKYSAQNRAEEFIIIYLMRNPDKLRTVKEKISSDEFVTGFNRRIFEEISEAISSSTEFSLSLLAEKFSEAEMGKICGIEAKNREININEETLSDCIGVLKNFNMSSVHNKTELSDDDLIQIQKNMQNKK